MMRRVLRGARTRITSAYLLLLLGSSAVALVAIDRLLSTAARERVASALVQEVEEFSRLAERGRDPVTGRRFGDLRTLFDTYMRRNVPSEGETVTTYVDGRVYRTLSGARSGRARFRGSAARFAAVRERTEGELTMAGDTSRFVAVPVTRARARGTFVVAAALSPEQEEVDEAVRVVGAVLLGVLLAGGALSWLVAGRVLAPMRALTDTARSISESDLTRRIAVTGRDELAELSRTFNAMLDRLEDAFDSQRAFIRDASHELRTPITIVRGHLELLGDDPQERRETVALVTDELDRMSRFVDDLLLLAQAGRRDFLRPDAVPLEDLTDELLAKARGLAPRAWSLDARGSGSVRADRQRLTQAVMGLAQNAAQHTEVGDSIALGTAVRNGHVLLWVRDAGPGVPEIDQGRIFESFARASNDRRRSDGAGLGLAIVRAIAEAHGGRVELVSRAGAGATFTLVIPR